MKKVSKKKSTILASKRVIAFKAKMDASRNWFDKTVDYLTASFGSIEFLIINASFFIIWMAVNSGFIPGLSRFDPFPYNFLTMAVSLEAIFLSIIVLMSQNRASKIADIREELDLRVNIQAEQEITRVLKMLDQLHRHLGLKGKKDLELKRMEQKTNVEKITQELVEEMKDN
jgi:uncharacterized membrane protein